MNIRSFKIMIGLFGWCFLVIRSSYPMFPSRKCQLQREIILVETLFHVWNPWMISEYKSLSSTSCEKAIRRSQHVKSKVDYTYPPARNWKWRSCSCQLPTRSHYNAAWKRRNSTCAFPFTRLHCHVPSKMWFLSFTIYQNTPQWYVWI